MIHLTDFSLNICIPWQTGCPLELLFSIHKLHFSQKMMELNGRCMVSTIRHAGKVTSIHFHIKSTSRLIFHYIWSGMWIIDIDVYICTIYFSLGASALSVFKSAFALALFKLNVYVLLKFVLVHLSSGLVSLILVKFKRF
ncbi:unnamed protein product [Cuscuta epithymum]|uniref:Uncharacterized protein n=1 Tax=Cuscuta epithymum TaxID=186058 RepID=A0AAV0E6X9_9ASTE|nr:unnamed protein product [Cuscuta epithymum]